MSKIFFMIIAPKEEGNAYLQVLSSVAAFFSQQEHLTRCIDAANTAEIIELMQGE